MTPLSFILFLLEQSSKSANLALTQDCSSLTSSYVSIRSLTVVVHSSMLFSMCDTLSSKTCMTVDILVNKDDRSAINEDWSDNSMSFRVVSITSCPVVGNEAMDVCKA